MEDYLYVARRGLLLREVLGEYVLVPQDSSGIVLSDGTPLPEFNGMVQLDEMGLFIWKQLDTPKTLNDLVSIVEDNFETNGQVISEDILEFLDTGFKNQIIFLTEKREQK